MDLRFPIWKPAPSNDDPSRIRMQESNANLFDQMQFAQLLLNAAGHVTPLVLSNCHRSLEITLLCNIFSISPIWNGCMGTYVSYLSATLLYTSKRNNKSYDILLYVRSLKSIIQGSGIIGVVQNHRPPTSHRPPTTVTPTNDHRPGTTNHRPLT